MMKIITDFTEYQALVAQYNQRGVRSNDYMQQEAESFITQQQLLVIIGQRNLFFFVKKEVGLRMYYYLNDFQEPLQLDDSYRIVTEILFRKEAPQDEVDYFLQSGFSLNLIRDQYVGMFKDLTLLPELTTVKVQQADTLEQVAVACQLFNDSFDHLSGDFISESSWQHLLDKGSIWLALNPDTQQILGALHQTTERGVHWISHVAVMPEARGRKIGPSLVRHFVIANRQDDKTRYQFWVQRQNEAAIKMYLSFGFKYMNKSTLSLIK